MKLYTFDPAPNPRRLALFMKLKGIEIDTQQVDMMAAEQLTDAYRQINPACSVPALVLDDGTLLTEVVGMYAYLEELHPKTPLMGSTAAERALVISGAYFVVGTFASLSWLTLGGALNQSMSSGRAATPISVAMGVLLLFTAVSVLIS